LDDRQHADLANAIRDELIPFIDLLRKGRKVDNTRIRGVISGEIGKWREEHDKPYNKFTGTIKRQGRIN